MLNIPQTKEAITASKKLPIIASYKNVNNPSNIYRFPKILLKLIHEVINLCGTREFTFLVLILCFGVTYQFPLQGKILHVCEILFRPRQEILALE